MIPARPEYPKIPERKALSEALNVLLETPYWDDIYEAHCKLSNQIDTLLIHINVLCAIAKVRPEKLDDILRIAAAHSEFERVMQAEHPLFYTDKEEG